MNGESHNSGDDGTRSEQLARILIPGRGHIFLGEGNCWAGADPEVVDAVAAANAYMTDLPPIYRPHWASCIAAEVAHECGGVVEYVRPAPPDPTGADITFQAGTPSAKVGGFEMRVIEGPTRLRAFQKAFAESAPRTEFDPTISRIGHNTHDDQTVVLILDSMHSQTSQPDWTGTTPRYSLAIMPAATSAISAPEQETGEVVLLTDFPVEASTTIYLGTITAVNAAGNAVPAADASGLRVLGRCEGLSQTSAEVINNAAAFGENLAGQDAVNIGAAGALKINIKRGIFRWLNSISNPVTEAGVGAPCFVQDNQTVASSSNNSIVAGIVASVDSEGVWVDTTRHAG